MQGLRWCFHAETVLRLTQRLYCCARVRLCSLLPPLQVRFVLSGGTENVQASLSNMTVARILPVVGAASHKHVHVSSLAPGEASLTATDEGLHHHRTATATVRCLSFFANPGDRF